MQQFEQAPVPADIQQQVTNIANSIGTVPSGETVEGQISSANAAIANINSAINGTGITDCNLAKNSGNYKAGPSTQNTPTSGYYTVQVINFTANDVSQIAIEVNNRKMYFRTLHDSTTWTSWQELALKSDIPTVSVGVSFNITLNDKGVASVQSANIPTVTGKTRSMLSLANLSSADLSASQIPPTVLETSGGNVYILGSPLKTYSGLQLRGLFI